MLHADTHWWGRGWAIERGGGAGLLHTRCQRSSTNTNKQTTNNDQSNTQLQQTTNSNPDHPTVVFYGHYDVQPALEPDWQTRPFELAAVDGYLYGRGTSDNKGPVLAFAYAVREMLDCWRSAGAALPVNVAFIIEGEEENGSTGFAEALQVPLCAVLCCAVLRAVRFGCTPGDSQRGEGGWRSGRDARSSSGSSCAP